MNHRKPKSHYFRDKDYIKAVERPDYKIEESIVYKIKGSLKRLKRGKVLLSEGNITKSDSFIRVKYIVSSNGAKLFFSDEFFNR
jgi:hypothetical protein